MKCIFCNRDARAKAPRETVPFEIEI